MNWNEWQDRQDDEGAALGDPRRCPRHPGEVTSSRDGMFDAPCGACEWAGQDEYEARRDGPSLAEMTPAEREAELAGRRAEAEAEYHLRQMQARADADDDFPF
jgi:hypothetical protein